MSLYSVILAAGEGKRMKSDRSKVLQEAAGKSLVQWAIDAAKEAGAEETVVVIGHMAEQVRTALGDQVTYAYQREQLGTGHAMMQGMESLKGKTGTVVVLYGDSPLMTAETLKAAVEEHCEAGRAATVITAVTKMPFGYGRIVRRDGSIVRIVEEKDANAGEKTIEEINSGMYLFDISHLTEALGELKNDNAQGEYYLTDVIEIMLGKDQTVGTFTVDFAYTLGVNDRVQLAQVDAILNARTVRRLMLEGVTVIQPETVRADADVRVGRDTVIYPGTILEGDTQIGSRCVIGPNTRLKSCRVGDETEIQYSVAMDSKIGDSTCVGPFAYIRPGSSIGSHIKVGDFVEVKNATIGDGTKIAHLTYVGDADVGQRVNFGCGTVVVNYDGVDKHRTVIEDDCFIGCNSNLVSPVTVKKGAYTAAGSTITDEVPEGSLAIARSRQVVKEGWTQKIDKRKEAKKRKQD